MAIDFQEYIAMEVSLIADPSPISSLDSNFSIFLPFRDLDQKSCSNVSSLSNKTPNGIP